MTDIAAGINVLRVVEAAYASSRSDDAATATPSNSRRAAIRTGTRNRGHGKARSGLNFYTLGKQYPMHTDTIERPR